MATDPWQHLAADMKKQAERGALPWVRCSALPRFFRCPSSIAEAQHTINSSSDAAAAGTGQHLAIHRHIQGEDPDLLGICEKYDISVEDMTEGFESAKERWAELQPSLEGHQIESEYKLRGTFCGGTTDVIGWNDRSLIIHDWKFGQNPQVHREQLLGYAYAACEQLQLRPDTIQTSVSYPMLKGDTELHYFDVDDLREFAEEFAFKASKADKTYNPGDACRFCPRQYECSARVAYIQHATHTLLEWGQDIPENVSRETLGDLYSRANQLEKCIAAFKKIVRQTLEADGPLDIGEGKYLTMGESRTEVLDAQKSWPLLAAQFDAAEINAFLALSKTKLVKALRDTAPRGQKEKVAEAFLDDLREAGAVTTHTIKKIQPRKAPKS